MAKKSTAPKNIKQATPLKPAVIKAFFPLNTDSFLERITPYWLGIILLLAFLVRILNLDALSLWIDEFVHVQRAKNFLEGNGPLFTDDNNGILLTWCMVPVFKLFGASGFAARIISVLFGIGVVYLTYLMGKKLFHRYVGLLAATAAALSLYLLFWSRMARNYAIFAFFYLLLGLVFLHWIEEIQKNGGIKTWWKRYAPWAGMGLAFLLSLLSHQLTFFFVFTAGLYAWSQALPLFVQRDKNRLRSPYTWIGICSIPFLSAIFIPPLGQAMRAPLSALSLSGIADWAIPQWSRVGALFAEHPWQAFSVYYTVLRYDQWLLYIPGILGFVLAFWLQRRSAWWLFCSFVVPFFLMSFVFREPFLPRYLIFIFPYFLIALAVPCWFVYEWVVKKYARLPNPMRMMLLFLPLLLIAMNVRYTEVMDIVGGKKVEGHVINLALSQWSFSNWQEPCSYIDQHEKPGDVILSTVPNAPAFYLNRNDIVWFRQYHYDTKLKKYVPNDPEPTTPYSAATFSDLKRTVESSPRGWLLGDYYLDNIFTDEEALLWVYRNLHFYPEASKNSSVLLFGWDHNSRPKPERQNFVVEVGRWADQVKSRIYHLSFPPEILTVPKLNLTLRRQHVNSNREGLVLFNDQNAAWIPANTGKEVEEVTIPIESSWLKAGVNTIQILYDGDRQKDPVDGFRILFLDIRM